MSFIFIEYFIPFRNIKNSFKTLLNSYKKLFIKLKMQRFLAATDNLSKKIRKLSTEDNVFTTMKKATKTFVANENLKK